MIYRMETQMKCYICGNECVIEEKLSNVPHKLQEQYDANRLKFFSIDIYRCTVCTHIQISSIVEQSYYRDYDMGYYWGEELIQIRKAQMRRLAEYLPSGKSLLDIGCGSGAYLDLAKDYFEELHGIEPSIRGVEHAVRKGYKITHGYFQPDTKLGMTYDAISLIEVLEHLDMPMQLFRHASDCLSENGMILVEVPNGQFIFDNRLYMNVITDHIQYFTVNSLAEMAKIAGLSVVCVQQSTLPGILELYARKPALGMKSFHAKREWDMNRILSQIPEQARVAAWGAGAESIVFLELLADHIRVESIFDSNQTKQGHYLLHIPIISPSAEKLKEYDAIILFASLHIKEIRGILQEYGYSGSVITY